MAPRKKSAQTKERARRAAVKAARAIIEDQDVGMVDVPSPKKRKSSVFLPAEKLEEVSSKRPKQAENGDVEVMDGVFVSPRPKAPVFRPTPLLMKLRARVARNVAARKEKLALPAWEQYLSDVPASNPPVRSGQENKPKGKMWGTPINESPSWFAPASAMDREPEVTPLSPYKDTVLAPGTYAISYKLNFTYEKTNKYGNSVHYQKDVLNASNKVIRGHVSLADALDDLIEHYRMHNHLEHYDFSINSVTGVDARLLEERRLADVPLKGAKLHYKFLGEVKNINKNQGQCVFDYLLTEIDRDRAAGKHSIGEFTRADLVAFFGEQSLIEGVSTRQIMSWAASKRYVSCYALDPLLQTFSQHTREGGRDGTTRHTLVFVVNNGHCYPVTDPDYKRQVINMGRIELDEFKFDVKFEDYQFVSQQDLEMEGERLSSGQMDKEVVLLEIDNLAEIVANSAMKTGFLAYNMRFSGNRVTCFEHPVTNKIYISAEDHDDRVAACQKLHELHQCTEFKFMNQSFTQIASSYFDIHYGLVKQSECSSELTTIFDNYRMRPYITQFKENYELGTLEGFDKSRCYSGILVNNEVDYNVFSSFDQPTKFSENDEIVCGEYYIQIDFFFGAGTIKICSGWYPMVLVKYALQKGAITKKDIAYCIKASYHLKHDTFKGFVGDVINIFAGSSTAKTMVNCFIGGLNHQYVTSTKGCITEDYDCAMGVVFSENTKGRTPKIHHVNDLFFIRSEFKERKTQTNMPIYRHILASAYIELDKLHSSVCDENTVVIAYHTDSIKVFRPKHVEIKEKRDLVPGDIRREEVTVVAGTFFDQLEVNEPFVYAKPEWARLDETDDNYDAIVEFVKSHSCIVTGMGGCGKTETIKRAWSDDSVALALTNMACENLRQRGVPNVHTLDSFFGEKESFKNKVAKTKRFKQVFVDEYSMVSTRLFSLLANIKSALGEDAPSFKLFGDTNQCTPIEDRKYDYNDSSLVKGLCGGNWIGLKYKPNTSRYDEPLHAAIVSFMQTQRLPVLPGVQLGQYYSNITATNNKRREVNAECLARFIAEFQPELKNIGGVTWAVGMPIISKLNVREIPLKSSIPVFNAQTFTIDRFHASSVVISRTCAGQVVPCEIPFEHFNEIMDPAFAITINRFQGSEINTHFNIHEIEKMNFNGAYTAISRGTLLEYVHFTPTPRKFYKVKPTAKSTPAGITEKTMIDGIVYKITDSTESFIYIGSTKNSIAQRLEEHRLKPVNPQMAVVIGNPDVTIQVIDRIRCTDVAALLRLEDVHIAVYMADEATKEKLLNVKLPKVPVPMKVTIVQEAPTMKEKFQILHYPNTRVLTIKGTVPAFGQTKAKRIQKKWVYPVGQYDSVKQLADEYRAYLIQTYINQA